MTRSSTQGIKTVLHPVSAATRAVRLGLGHTRDVSMIDGEVEVIEIDALPQERGERFGAHTGFDSRAPATPYRWFRISRRIQAWREVNEMPDRERDREGGPDQQMEIR